MAEKNGYVKWRDFGAALLAFMTLIIALWAFSVSDGEFAQFANGVDNRFDSLDIILQEIKTEIRDLRNMKK